MAPSLNKVEFLLTSLAAALGLVLPDPFWWALSGGFFGASASVLADETSPLWRKLRRFCASLCFAVGLTEMIVYLGGWSPTRQVCGGIAALLALVCWPVLLAFEKHGLRGFAQLLPELLDYYRTLKGSHRAD